jgi:hypothetical protein
MLDFRDVVEILKPCGIGFSGTYLPAIYPIETGSPVRADS